MPWEAESCVESCVICLEPISEKSVASPCHHAYDFLCLLSWLEVRQSCPLCNTTIEYVDVVDVTSGELNRVSLYPHERLLKLIRGLQHKIEPPRPLPSSTTFRAQGYLSLRGHDRSLHLPRRRPRTPEPIAPDLAILRRRFIYKHQLRSNHIGSNRISRFQNFTPLQFLRDPELQSRARNFIRRELNVFEWIQAENNTEFLLEYVVGILKSVDLKSASGAAEDMLTDFLGRRNARIFLHELHAFLRSPFTNLSNFDSFAQYARPIPIRFSDGEDLVVNNSDRETEEEDYNEITQESGTGSSSVSRAERVATPGRWRSPYSREQDMGRRARSYDSYRPSYRSS